MFTKANHSLSISAQILKCFHFPSNDRDPRVELTTANRLVYLAGSSCHYPQLTYVLYV